MEGALPEGWVEARLGDLGEWRGGGTPTKSNPGYWTNGTIPWVSPKDMKVDEIHTAEDSITVEAVAKSATSLVPAGSLLVVVRSGILNRTLPVAVSGAEVAVNQDIKALIPHGAVLPKFLIAYFHARESAILHGAAKSGTTVASIDLERLKSQSIPLPPLNEQRRIVARLEELTERTGAARAALEAIPPLLDRFRQSVLAAAFRGDLTADWRAKNPDVEPASELLKRIRVERRQRWEEAELEKMRAKGKVPGDDRWKARYAEPEGVNAEGLPELPEGWVWVTWEQTGLCQNGRAFPSRYYTDHGPKLLRPGNLLADGHLSWTDCNTAKMPQSWEEEYPDYVVRGNELIMNLTAQSLKDEFLGRTCLTADGEHCLLNQRLARLTPVALSREFCLWLFKSPLFRTFVDGLNTGSLIQHMFTSQVQAFRFPLPPAAEQAQIVSRVREYLSFAALDSDRIGQSVFQLTTLHQALLAKAFRGELVPQDPADEPASVLLEGIRQARQAAGATGKSRRGRKAKQG